MTLAKETVSDKLEAVDLAADRFISVNDGEKKSVDHDTRYSRAENVPGKNYGIYADEDDQFFIFDVDDHEDGEENSTVALAALDGLPETLRVKSPHVADEGAGGHRLFKLDGEQTPAELFNERFGTKNPVPTWGEVVSKNKYCVGAGSQLDGCNKDWCNDCATADGGKYSIQEARAVAVVDPERVIEALDADADLQDTHAESTETLEEFDGQQQSATNNTTPTPTGADKNREYDDLEREQVEAMLRTIPGDQDYDDWLRTMYAVFDWDDTNIGKQVFTKWSAGDDDCDFERNKKWDSKESPRQIEYTWNNGETGDGKNKSTVGTLVHIARQHGFEFETTSNSPPEASSESGDNPGAEPSGSLEPLDGEYWKKTPNFSDDEQEFDWERVTTFQLETVERLQTDDGERLTLRVYPAHPSEDNYEVDVHPTVFNEHRSFKEKVVRGRTTSFNGGHEDLNALRKTVGVQDAPSRIASEHIGLAGDSYNEWVAPNGTLMPDGADDNPTHRYHTKGGSADTNGSALARKWQLEADDLEYDDEAVAKIAELLPQTRKPERGIPILGWFYAAPLRPLIHEWADEFNLLQVIGSTGTGKTSTLKTYWEAFGMQPDPFSASDTTFTLTKHMSSSRGVPVWIDEYKPADIDDRRLDKLHRRLREVTKGTAVSKGKPDLGEIVFRLEAPVVVSGEQKFSRNIPAVRRRTIMTSLSTTATEDGSSYQRAFARLTGTAYTDGSGDVQYPDGCDLSEHARAYYSFILNEDPELLKAVWKSCKERTAEILASRDYTLDETEFRGLQTVLFGIRIHSKFASEHGVESHKLPSSAEIGDAFEHLASNIGKRGRRRGYDDIFLELFSQAASAGYLEKEIDFKFYESSKHGDEVLALHMPSVYADVKRYVRDYNLGDEYNIIGKTDYVSALADKAGNDSHVLAVNHVVRLDGGRAKCVVIHPKRTQQRLGSDFDLRAYEQDAVTDADTAQQADDINDGEPTGSGSQTAETAAYLSAGEVEATPRVKHREKVPPVRGTIMAIWENRYGQPVTELHDEDGSIDIQIVGFDSPALTPLSEGGEYELEGLRYYDPDDERAYYEFRPTTGIERLDETDADASSDDDGGGDGEHPETTEQPQTAHSADDEQAQATADGGTTPAQNTTEADESDPRYSADLRERVAAAFDAAVDEDTNLANKMPLQRELEQHCEDMRAAKQLIERAKTQGWISEPEGHRYRRQKLPKVGGSDATSGTEADDHAEDDGDHDDDGDDPHSIEAESITNPDENAPDTQAKRMEVFKDTLDESTKNGEWLTADDLEAKLGWERGIIDGILEKLRRNGTVLGDEDMGWKYYQ